MALDRVHPLVPDELRRLDSVLHAVRHLLALSNDVLDLARIEQEDFALQQSTVDLPASVGSCIALIQPLADRAGVRLVPSEAARVWAIADERAVEQVLIDMNLPDMNGPTRPPPDGTALPCQPMPCSRRSTPRWPPATTLIGPSRSMWHGCSKTSTCC